MAGATNDVATATSYIVIKPGVFTKDTANNYKVTCT